MNITAMKVFSLLALSTLLPVSDAISLRGRLTNETSPTVSAALVELVNVEDTAAENVPARPGEVHELNTNDGGEIESIVTSRLPLRRLFKHPEMKAKEALPLRSLFKHLEVKAKEAALASTAAVAQEAVAVAVAGKFPAVTGDELIMKDGGEIESIVTSLQLRHSFKRLMGKAKEDASFAAGIAQVDGEAVADKFPVLAVEENELITKDGGENKSIVTSLHLRHLFKRLMGKAEEDSPAFVATVTSFDEEEAAKADEIHDLVAENGGEIDDMTSDKERKLQSYGITPAWHPNYAAGWMNGHCRFTVDENSPGYVTELACCQHMYPNQISGYCFSQLLNPPTTSPIDDGELDVYYPDYTKEFADGICINTYPLPIGRITFTSKLACCDGAYGGQSSGKCLSLLPSLTCPADSKGLDVYYPDYTKQFPDGICINDAPLPNSRVAYTSQEECCQRHYGDQQSQVCICSTPNPPSSCIGAFVYKPSTTATISSSLILSDISCTEDLSPAVVKALECTIKTFLSDGLYSNERVSVIVTEICGEQVDQVLRHRSRRLRDIMPLKFTAITVKDCVDCTESTLTEFNEKFTDETRFNKILQETSQIMVGIKLLSTAGFNEFVPSQEISIIDNKPSVTPSLMPSDRPSLSGRPSDLPSTSGHPSMNPSLSSMPSGQPSMNPSVSNWPTSQPSESPSLSERPSSLPSSMPSSVPSEAPSVSGRPSLSMNPSLSSMPSSVPSIALYCIQIAVDYDYWPEESLWELQRVDINGDILLVNSYSAADDDTSNTVPMCLQEGEYEFTIYDSYGDGLCCSWGEGHYKVTTSNSYLIAEGGEFESEETTRFSLPFAPSP